MTREIQDDIHGNLNAIECALVDLLRNSKEDLEQYRERIISIIEVATLLKNDRIEE